MATINNTLDIENGVQLISTVDSVTQFVTTVVQGAAGTFGTISLTPESPIFTGKFQFGNQKVSIIETQTPASPGDTGTAQASRKPLGNNQAYTGCYVKRRNAHV